MEKVQRVEIQFWGGITTSTANWGIKENDVPVKDVHQKNTTVVWIGDISNGWMEFHNLENK